MSQSIIAALCSFGMSGRVFHGPLLTAHPGFQLKGAWQRSKRDFSEAYPDGRIYKTYEELLADTEIELVVVNTPEYTHFDYAQKALRAGKHVVSEKAFTVTVAEAEALIRIADEENKVLAVFQNRRWDNDFLTVKKVIEEGVLGRLVSYEARYDRYRTFLRDSWKEKDQPGTGILYNLGSHLIDQTLSLFGRPTWVWADLRVQRTNGMIPDHFELIMDYGEMKARLTAGYLVAAPPYKYQIFGETGTFQKHGSDPQEEHLAAGRIPGGEGWGTEASGLEGILTTASGNQLSSVPFPSVRGNYLNFYEEVYQAIRLGNPDFVNGNAGKEVIQIIEAAIRASESGMKQAL